MARQVQTAQPWKYARLVYALLAIFAIAFILITCIVTPNADNGIPDGTKYLAAYIAIALPEIVVWILALTAAVRFKEYVYNIRDSKDGDALNLIADALLFLAAYIVVLTAGNMVTSLFVNSSLLNAAVAVENYFPMLLAFVSAAFFFRGARRLNEMVPFRLDQVKRWTVFAATVLLVLIFGWYFYVHFPDTLLHTSGVPRFSLSREILLVTYAMPYAVLWIVGASACVRLANYSRHVQGTLYRRLFKDFSIGLLIVFISTFLAQFIIVSNLELSGFDTLFVLTYGLLALGVYGYYLILKGVSNLQRLEAA